MQIYINSLKLHKLFPNDTSYNVLQTDKNIIEPNNLDLHDDFTENDIEYVKFIIQKNKKLRKLINPEIFNEIKVQININDYSTYNIIPTNNFLNNDLMNNDLYAKSILKIIFWGTKFFEEDKTNFTFNHMLKEDKVNFILMHELSHVLEVTNRENYSKLPINTVTDQFIDIIQYDQQCAPCFTSMADLYPGKIFNVLITQSTEMYADILSILLNHSNNQNLDYTEKNIDSIIQARRCESTIWLEKNTSNIGFPGIMSDHLTLNALTILKENIHTLDANTDTLENMDLFAQKIVRHGIFTNFYIMLNDETMKPDAVHLFNKLTGGNFSSEYVIEKIEKELTNTTIKTIKTIFDNKENTNLEKYTNLFHSENSFNPVNIINSINLSKNKVLSNIELIKINDKKILNCNTINEHKIN